MSRCPHGVRDADECPRCLADDWLSVAARRLARAQEELDAAEREHARAAAEVERLERNQS